MQKYLNWKLAGIIVMTLIFGFVAIPSQYLPNFVTNSIDTDKLKVVLGLDLQGGTQLDYRVDLRKVPEAKQDQIIEGVTEVISRRVNALGVAEPNIYTSTIGDEQHIIVELAGISDIEEAKSRVGKTIQLEFKEQREGEDTDQIEAMRTLANEFVEQAKADPEKFQVLAELDSQSQPDRISFSEVSEKFRDEIGGEKIQEALFNTAVGQITEVIEDDGGLTYDIENGQVREQNGLFVLKVTDRQDNVEREKITQEKAVKTQHILITHKDADGADEEIERDKSDALALTNELIDRINAGEDFTELAKEFSEDPGVTENDGIYEDPVTANGSQYVEEYTEAALELTENNQITEPVESQFGYHIIKALEVTPEIKETLPEAKISYQQIFFSTQPDPWQETGLDGEHFVSASVDFDNLLQPYVAIQFDSEGARLFEEITERNVNKPLAMFVGGELISDPPPIVQTKISDGRASITGNFNIERAEQLARDLNTGAIPAPITLAGQYTIGSSLGQVALQTSLIAGLIGLVVLCVYMIAYYRLLGGLAVAALIIYSLALLFIIKAALPVVLAILGGLTIGCVSLMNIFNNNETSAEKFISSLIALFALFFFTFLFREQIVLTLAGIAGLIMSIGIAVDANILIFERIREELKSGQSYQEAIKVGFARAWSSIRDSNFSSLIICIILFYFGSSIIKGFALNLAAGILLSMFTAITITRSFLLLSALNGKEPSNALLGASKNNKPAKTWEIVKSSRLWLAISTLVLIVCLGGLLVRGLNPGIDFRGGTLMEIAIEDQEIDRATIETELNNIIASLNEDLTPLETEEANTEENAEAEAPEAEEVTTEETETESEESEKAPALEPATQSIIDEASVISSTDQTGTKSFIARFGYVTNETHDQILAGLKNRFGKLEENRFTTIGPTVSDQLKQKALFAVFGALVVIIFYIAFAFRNVPKEISPWKFGGAAIIALVHDVLITLGIFSILHLEIDALFITAILAVVGFSINDTIVVFDRLRENLKGFKASKTRFAEIANEALNQTLVRSLNTSISTLFPLLALLVFGAESIFNFILALTIGILVGTYSSIFIATPVLVRWYKSKNE